MATETVTIAATKHLPSQTQALVLHGPRDLRMETHSLPAPLSHEVQIAILRIGLCGSDCHYYNHGRNGNFTLQEPLALGHEAAGVITCVGSGIWTLSPGDQVALEVGVACGTCEYCLPNQSRSSTGMSALTRTISLNGTSNPDGVHHRPTEKSAPPRYNLCTKMRFRSSAASYPHYQGLLQTRVNHPAQWCHLLPNALSADSDVRLDLGALLEPLSVALHASRRARMRGGEDILVLGSGAVGLLCAWVARKRGAKRIVIADRDEGRVNWASSRGWADQGVVASLVQGTTTEERFEGAMKNAKRYCAANCDSGDDQTDPVDFDLVFECTGAETCVQSAIYSAKAGGRVLLVGMGTPVQTLPLGAAAIREVDLCGVFRYAGTYPEGIDMISKREKGIPDLAEVVTHRYKGLERAREAFGLAGRGGRGPDGNLALKCMVELGVD